METVKQFGNGFYFPKTPVKIGDTWKVDFTPSLDAQTKMHVAVDVTFVGVETMRGIKCVKLKVSSDTSANDATGVKIHTDQMCYINPSNGKLIHTSSKGDGGFGDSKMTMEMNCDLLPAEAKPAN